APAATRSQRARAAAAPRDPPLPSSRPPRHTARRVLGAPSRAQSVGEHSTTEWCRSVSGTDESEDLGGRARVAARPTQFDARRYLDLPTYVAERDMYERR